MLAQNHTNPVESTLGLKWNCVSDYLSYRYKPQDQYPLSMRRLYQVLARLYDLLEFITPYTTKAKILVL